LQLCQDPQLRQQDRAIRTLAMRGQLLVHAPFEARGDEGANLRIDRLGLPMVDTAGRSLERWQQIRQAENPVSFEQGAGARQQRVHQVGQPVHAAIAGAML